MAAIHQITKIKPFKLEWIYPGSNILVCGRRGMGKTHLILDLLTHREKSLPVVFASKYVLQKFKRYLPEGNVLDKFDENKLEHLLERQLCSEGTSEVILAFDDVAIEDHCLMDNRTVRDIVKYGSSLNITSVFSVQHAGVYDETFRRNVDYLFVFHDNLVEYQDVLYKKYANMFKNFEQFQDVYNKCTTNPYRCLVLDMRTPWNQSEDSGSFYEDSIFWYTSSDTLPSNIDKVEHIQWNTHESEPEQEISHEQRGCSFFKRLLRRF